MRRESSTVIALVGQVSGRQLTALAESGNVSVVRPAESGPPDVAATARAPGSGTRVEATPPAWERGALGMREAARRRATYVVVPNDPLAGLASAWREMWEVAAGPAAAAAFEEQAADTLAAWRAKQFELPDYYLVVAPAQHVATGPDFYLGPLRAARPRRVAVATTLDSAADANGPAVTASLLDTLRSLEHGPWWPPLDELVDATRRFYAGGLAEAQQARYS
jgi:hypothetical protein